MTNKKQNKTKKDPAELSTWSSKESGNVAIFQLFWSTETTKL